MNRIVEVMNSMPQHIHNAGHAGAAGAAWLSFLTDILPIVATVLSIMWFGLQIYAWVVNKSWKKKKK